MYSGLHPYSNTVTHIALECMDAGSRKQEAAEGTKYELLKSPDDWWLYSNLAASLMDVDPVSRYTDRVAAC